VERKGGGTFELSRGTPPSPKSQRACSGSRTRTARHRYSMPIHRNHLAVGRNAPMRFFNRLGATEVSGHHLQHGRPRGTALPVRYLAGRIRSACARDAECIVVWGANPHASAPHAHDHWLPERRGKVVVIDPVRTPTAVRADIHLHLSRQRRRVGFALLHVILARVWWTMHSLRPTSRDGMNCGRRFRLQPGMGDRSTGVPIASDRGSRKVVRARALIVMAGPRAAASNDGRQCHSRLRAAARGSPASMQTRGGLL